MSASHRSLARLPLSVFEGLVEEANDGSSLGREDVDSRENATAKEAQEEQEAQRQDAAIQLRMQLCDKLQHVKLASSSSHPSWFLGEEGPLWNMNASGTVKIKTVGDFFWLPLWTLVETLDPLLTYGAYNTVCPLNSVVCGSSPMAFIHSFSHDWFPLSCCTVECQELQRRIAAVCSPETIHSTTTTTTTGTTAWDLWQDEQPSNRQPTAIESSVVFPGVGTGLPTGLKDLDQQLLPHGGLSRGTVTELVGPAGVGKSQCAFQLCLHVAQRRETAIYIDTEGKAMARHRLREMAAAATATRREPHDEYEYQDHTGSLVRPEGHAASSSSMGGLPFEDSSYPIEYWSFPESSLEDLVQTILVQVQEFVYLHKEELEEEEEQESTVNTTGGPATMALDAPYSQNGWLEPSHSHAASQGGWYTSLRAPKQQQQHSILDDSYPQQQQQQRRRRRPVSLIVVDSIAAPFRRYSHSSSSSSSQQLLQVAQTLKRMAHEFHVCVVVVNQVASSTGDGMTLERRESRQVDTQAGWWEENPDEHTENATSANQESLDSHDYNNYHYYNDTTAFPRIHNDGQDHTSNHGSSFRAALGTSWHHCVSTRILFTPAMDTTYPSDNPQERRTKGFASIVKSNLIATPTVPVPYTITLQGLEAL